MSKDRRKKHGSDALDHILDPLDSGHWTSSDLVNLQGLQGDMAEHLSISPLPFANFAMP